jgi:SAM-dependent methyltransferase
VNSFQHWPDPAADLLEIRRVQAPGGRLVLCLRVHDPEGGRLSSPGFRPHELGRVRALLREAGFADVRSETRDLGRTATCILATR